MRDWSIETSDELLAHHSFSIGLHRIYQLTCERLGLPPHETIVLDDYEPNVSAAREFGMQASLFNDTRRVIAEVGALLEDAATSLTDLVEDENLT